MKYEICGLKCSIEIPLVLFLELDLGQCSIEYFEEINGWNLVEDLNYDGHFGHYVFFTADTAEEAEKFTTKLAQFFECYPFNSLSEGTWKCTRCQSPHPDGNHCRDCGRVIPVAP